jgi:hypothetical protein
MHILTMFLQHVVVCKISEFILHRVWLEMKKAFDLAIAAFVLWLFSPLWKSTDKFASVFGVVLLFIAAGVVSSGDFNLAPARLFGSA